MTKKLGGLKVRLKYFPWKGKSYDKKINTFWWKLANLKFEKQAY